MLSSNFKLYKHLAQTLTKDLILKEHQINLQNFMIACINALDRYTCTKQEILDTYIPVLAA